jgi:uncharacterized metal-binding protein YceD (DUF177 family)
MSASSPYSYPFDLTSVSQQGTELHLSPDVAEKARIAGWLGALEVSVLGATVRLAQLGNDDYSCNAEFSAEVVQACVVTLEPVRSVHSGTFSRRYRVMAKPASRRSPRTFEAEPDNEEDYLEVVGSPVIDLAAPLLEELSLVLDPYPRAAGVKFEPPKEVSQGNDSPFAVLAKLKQSQKREPEPRK